VAKDVFRPTEITNLTRKVYIEAPEKTAEEKEEEAQAEVEEYQGPTLEEVKNQIEEYRRQWEAEKAQMINEAQEEADRIKKESEEVAFDEVKKKNNEAQKVKKEAEEEAERIRQEAQSEADEIKSKAEQNQQAVEKEAYDKGFAAGKEAGFQEGQNELNRLTEQLHSIISRALDKRNEIIEETETQIINLVLLISKKVIKVISENQKNVVINNVVQALRKLKSRGEVVVRVNLADVNLASENVDNFMKMVQNVKSVTVVEDSSVDRGGCIIETDFGEIDARISSQLNEIEEKIVELMPIRAKGEE